jgi:hypothetical protein
MAFTWRAALYFKKASSHGPVGVKVCLATTGGVSCSLTVCLPSGGAYAEHTAMIGAHVVGTCSSKLELD